MPVGLRHVRASIGNALPAPVSTFFARADSDVPTGATLEVYVKGQEASTPDVLAAMSRELDALMQPAGFRVVWRGAGDPPSSRGSRTPGDGGIARRLHGPVL